MKTLSPSLASRFGLGSGLGLACVLSLASGGSDTSVVQDPPAGLSAAFEKGGVFFDADAATDTVELLRRQVNPNCAEIPGVEPTSLLQLLRDFCELGIGSPRASPHVSPPSLRGGEI